MNQPLPRPIPALLLEQKGHLRGSQITRLMDRIERGAFTPRPKPALPILPINDSKFDRRVLKCSLVGIAACVIILSLL